jgi:putative colanic acid biosynthesis glycosyltransferase WcaI
MGEFGEQWHADGGRDNGVPSDPAERRPGARRILVHDHCGHPFQLQLSRELARRGHEVLHLYCGSFVTGKGAVDDADVDGFRVEAVTLPGEFAKYSPWTRLRQEREYGRMLRARARLFAPEIVLSANTPLLVQKHLLAEAKRLGSRFVFWQQDALGLGIKRVLERRYGRLGSLAGNRFVRFERSLLLKSDAVVVISEGFLPMLEKLGVPSEKTYVVENWAPLDELAPRPGDNDWSREQRLVGKRVVLYSGTLGLKHDPEVIVQLAVALRDRDDVEVVVVTEGRGEEWLRRRRDEEGLTNLRLLPFQPYADLPDVLGSADILLALLEADAGAFSVPSKVLSYLCAGRPLLAAIPSDNLAAHVIRRSGAGFVVEPGDWEALIAQAVEMLNDPGLCRELGGRARQYAEENFDIGVVADRFEPILDPLACAGSRAIAETKAR